MSWFEIGAVVIGVLFALNFVVFAARRKPRGEATAAAATTTRPIVAKSVPRDQAVIYGLMVASWVVCFGAPYVAPDTPLGQAMSRPGMLVSAVVWTMAIAVIAAVALTMRRRRRSANG